MNETTTIQDEQITTTLTEVQELTEQETESEQILNYNSMPDMSNNDLHSLFLTLGVDLDYVPQNDYEAFTMGCQLITALLFLGFFLVYLFKVIKTFTGGRR